MIMLHYIPDYISYFHHSPLRSFYQYSKYLMKMNSLISLSQTELKLQPTNNIPKIIPPLSILYTVNKTYIREHLYTVIVICMSNNYLRIFTSIGHRFKIVSIFPEAFGYLGLKQKQNKNVGKVR